jgi:Rrf2 family iron-sulfur cluster assembly transcriptional regulator
MLDLVLHSQNTPVTLTEIATRQTISLSYLEQLFSRLRKADLVKGVRGPGGGYRIRQTPELISIASIIEAVNEPIDSTKCGGEENCQHDSICLTHDLWAGLSDHIQDYLSQITLADLIAQRDERRNIVKCSESIVKFEKPLKYG